MQRTRRTGVLCLKRECRFLLLLLCLVTLVAGGWAPRPGASPATGLLYVADLRSSDVRIVNAGTGELVRRIRVAEDPHELACVAGTLWVSDYRSALVTRLSNHRGVFGTVPIEGDPHGLAASGRWLAVTQGRTGTITLVDTLSEQRHVVVTGGEPFAAAATADRVYVLDAANDAVLEIDTESGTILARSPVGRLPESLAVSPDGGTLAVASAGTDELTLLDTATLTPTARMRLPGAPVRVAYAPDGGTIAVSLTNRGSVALLMAAGTTIRTIAVGRLPDGLSFSPDGKNLFVALSGEDRVAVVSISRLSVTRYIKTGEGPSGILLAALGACANPQ